MAVSGLKLGFRPACIRQNETASSMVKLNTTLPQERGVWAFRLLR